MTRAPALCLFLGASALLSACDIPPATFDGPSTSGSGGAGSGVSTSTASGGTGALGGSGGAPNGTGGTGGVVAGPVVPCSFPAVAPCAPKQVCCYDKTGPDPVDFCTNPGLCNPQAEYAELQCNDNLDCPGQVCCLYYTKDAMGKLEAQKTYCDPDCDAPEEAEGCLTSDDCEGTETCQSFEDYQDYKFCF